MSKLKKLRGLEQQTQRLRRDLRISKPGDVLYRAHQNQWSDNEIVVEADGSGGAALLIIEGNYPMDYLVHSEKSFTSEKKACDAADDLVR